MPLDSFVAAYRLERVLGRGGQAVVYLGTHQDDGSQAALKLPLGDNVDRLAREAQALEQLDHPAVVRLMAADLSDRRPHLVLEYLEGGSLADKLRAHPDGLPADQAMQCARRIVAALEHAHERGVLHRDLKPSNVLFAADGSCKLSDFGAGKVRQNLELSRDLRTRTRVVGTPTYLAPELEDARFLPEGGQVDERADLYSLGKLLYTMLTGLPPRTIKPLSRVRPGIDPAWEKLIFALVEEDPGRRPRNAQAVDAALGSIAERLDRRGGVRRSIESYKSSLQAREQLDRDSAALLPAQPPEGISSSHNRRALKLVVRSFRWSAFLTRLIVGILLAIPVWSWCQGDELSEWLGSWRHAPLVLGLGCLYLAAAHAVNRATLGVQGATLRCAYGPLPVRPSRHIALASVRAYLFTYGVIRTGDEDQMAWLGRPSSHPRAHLLGYQVGVRTERQRFLSLVSLETYEQAAYVVDRIRAYLKEHRPEVYRAQVDIADGSAGNGF